MGKLTNHCYIDQPLSNFFKNSVILNSESADGQRMKRDEFVLLATYGYYLGMKLPFEKPTSEGSDIFVMNQLDQDQLAILYAIAISDQKDIQVILDEVKVAKIAMEYANGGLLNLKKIEKNSQLNKELLSFRVIIKDAYKEFYENDE